ncbi:hypothetical protein ACIQF6_28325 [Kitasatospora sp. NPDC092948]|uniref:hypothetical protein n=1 Tax=Kitasatospora sp. NPDC092948 TaxID=3364088 RepID=UPI0038114667
MDWTIKETAEVPKARTGKGDDRLLVRSDNDGLALLAVVDGTTDKSGRHFDGRCGGALAAECVVDTLCHVRPNTPPAELVATVTRDLAEMHRRWGIGASDTPPPSAVAAIFLPRQGVVVRVGDVHLALRRRGEWQQHPANKRIDVVAAEARAALLAAHLRAGVPLLELAEHDPGREMILPLLRSQHHFANKPDSDDGLAFGVLNGRPVPQRFVESLDLDGATEIVLATDGYLGPSSTLSLAEHALQVSLAQDPLRIGAYPATKGIRPGANGHDDRTYVRLVRDDPDGPR